MNRQTEAATEVARRVSLGTEHSALVGQRVVRPAPNEEVPPFMLTKNVGVCLVEGNWAVSRANDGISIALVVPYFKRHSWDGLWGSLIDEPLHCLTSVERFLC